LELCYVVRDAAIVECGVETKVFGDVPDFFVGACDADDAAAVELRNLTDDRADGTCCAGNEDGFSRLWLADVEQAKIGGQSGHAKDADECRERSELRINS